MSIKAYRYSDEAGWRGAGRRMSAGRSDASVGGSKLERVVVRERKVLSGGADVGGAELRWAWRKHQRLV